MRALGGCARSIGGLVGVESSRGVAGCSELRALNDCQGKQSKGWIDSESEVSTLVLKVVRLVLKKVGYADPYHCGAEALESRRPRHRLQSKIPRPQLNYEKGRLIGTFRYTAWRRVEERVDVRTLQ